MVGIRFSHHVSHACHGAKLSALSCDVQDSQQITVMFVNVNQVSVTIIAIINRRRRQVQGRNQSRQSRQMKLFKTSVSLYLPSSFSVLYLLHVFFIMFRFMSFNQSSSQSSCLTAVSNSVESHHSQVLHLLSVAVVTFTSRMAAAPQPINEAAAQVAKSMQSMTVAHVKNEELNNNAQVPLISSLHPVRWSQLRRIKSCSVSWSRSRSTVRQAETEHLLKCLIKSQMADHPQQWDDHCGDNQVLHWQLQVLSGRLWDVVQCISRLWSILPGVVRVRVHVMADIWMDQVTATLKLARKPSRSGLSCDSHVQQDRWCHQSLVLPQGGSRLHVQLPQWVRSWKILHLLRDASWEGRRHPRSVRGIKGKILAHSHRSGFNVIRWRSQVQEGKASSVLFIPSDLVSRDGDVQHLSECLIVHDSARAASWVSCDFKLVPPQRPSWRSCSILKWDSLRESSKSFEAVILTWKLFSFSGGKFRQSVAELDIDRSFTVVDMRINPWEIKESASSSMDVEDVSFKRGKRSSGSNQGSAVLTINSGRLTFGWAQVMSVNLDWSQHSPSSSKHHLVSQLGQLSISLSSSSEHWSAQLTSWGKDSWLWPQPQRERV